MELIAGYPSNVKKNVSHLFKNTRQQLIKATTTEDGKTSKYFLALDHNAG